MGKIKQQPAKASTHVKQPGTSSQGSTNQQFPVFCLRFLSNFKHCTSEDHAALASTLHGLGQLTWQQIQCSDRDKSGHEQIPVDRLTGVVLTPFASDQPHVLAFRYKGKAPMLGIREGEVLRILHLDRDFTAYRH